MRHIGQPPRCERGERRDNAEFLFGKLYKRGEPDEELERRYVEDYFAIDERFRGSSPWRMAS